MVGAGPNGLAAAITLARAGRSVLVREAADTVGGGTRSAELTLPGVVHDVCSAIHPLAAASPFFRELPLAEHELDFLQSPAPLAHPLDDGTAVMLERSIEATAAGLGEDGPAYRQLFEPLVADWARIEQAVLGPRLVLPRNPVALARFGMKAVRSARGFAEGTFRGERARALFAGAAAHSIVPLERAGTAAFGLLLALLGHRVGWPFPHGGSQRIADALAAHLRSLGGEIETGSHVDSLRELPGSRAVLCDVTPRGLLRIAGDRLPAGYRRRLERYQYGPGAFKADFVLEGPIPWAAPECARAATVHVGGPLEEYVSSERAPWEGRPADRPSVLLAQPSLFDPTRAPQGTHVVWTYCHVPNGSPADMTERIEHQIERFAPGFRERIVARATMGPADFERHNENLVGGDISGGATHLRQLLARPVLSLVPYATPVRGLFLCSSSTPPGGGVHGMCGHLAARAALKMLD